MATTVSTTIPADNSSLGYWEKTVTDVNNVDESFANARDLGYTRLNYARVSVVGKLSEYYDSSDMYKIQLQSNGTVSLSIKGGDSSNDGFAWLPPNLSNEKVLDLSAYEQKLDELKRITDPEGWAKEQEEKKLAEQNKDWMAELAPGLKVEVYTINKNGKETLIGDSSAEKGTETRDNIDAMFSGEYKAKKDTMLYIKITRDDTVSKNEELAYVLQIQQGEKYKHDYVSKEGLSDDSKNKTETRIPLTQTSASGSLSSVNALQIQASKYEATAQMLQVGYLNMANILNSRK